MPIRLICSLIALSQLLWFAAPAQAQGLPNFWPSPGTGGYYNGTGGVYVPRTTAVRNTVTAPLHAMALPATAWA